MATGRPVESEEAKKLRAGEAIEMWPSVRGGKNWPHAAFNPNTGLLYANTIHSYSTYRFIDLVPYKAGMRYQGIENKYPPVKPGDLVDHIEAIDPVSAEAKVAGAAMRLPRSRRRCWQPAADCCSMGGTPESSLRWTRTPARRYGNTAPVPVSTACRSRGPTRANST
jgi:hypothetical protein